MLASKPNPSSGLPEGSNSNHHKPRRATSAPRVSRLAKPAGGPSKPADRAPSPLHHHAAGIALDRSSASIDLPAKPSPGAAAAAERRSFKAAAAAGSSRIAATDKQQRIAKASELQAQLGLVQEDLRNARERLAAMEGDRAQLLEDLALARRVAADAAGKLEESLAARRRAEEALELERFESTEREQSGVDLAQRAADEWRRKHDNVKRRHAEDVASLIAATRELDGVKGELAAAAAARDAAVGQADELQQLANGNARKAEALTAEVGRLEAQLEAQAEEAAGAVGKLEAEASALRAELREAKAASEEKLAGAEEMLQGLRVDIAYAKGAEADATRSAQEWRSKAEALEARLEEVSQLKERSEESLASLTSSFEDCTSMLQDKQAQVIQLEEKMASLEKEASEHREGLLETSRRLEVATKEASELQAAIDGLRSEHRILHEAHRQVVIAEETARAQVGKLTEDKDRLLRELDDTRDERDKVKKAVEDLAGALREVSSEARGAKERVLAKQAELDNAQLQVSEMKAAMKNAEDRHQLMLDESNYETACLRKAVEKMGSEAKSCKDEWISKEAGFVDMLKRSDDGMSSIQTEMNRVTESLRVAEKEVQELRAEKIQLLNKLQEFEFQATNTSSNAEEAKAEISHLKDLVSFKDKELLALNHEVTELRLRERAASEKASELSKLLADVTARKTGEENTDKSTKALPSKLEMEKLVESLKAAECEAKAAKDEKAQLQSKVRLLESRITEASLTSEEAKISSLRLKETLEDKEHELESIAQEMRGREAAAQARIDELAALLTEATARRGGEQPLNGTVAARSPEKQPSALLKLICSPMHHRSVVGDEDYSNGESVIIPMEDIKHVEVETVRQVRRDKEMSIAAVDANCLENSKIIEDDLCKERGDDYESDDDDDDDDTESPPGDDGLVDQMNGLLMHGPTSSFNQDQHQQAVHKKNKKALLRKFGSMLKKKAHFTKLSSHS